MDIDNRMTILIVEDDDIPAREINAFLGRWGYIASNVSRFDAVLEEVNRAHPHLILLDINLPYYDGFYWCSRIRECSQVPVIFISSRDDDRDKIMAIAQGGADQSREEGSHMSFGEKAGSRDEGSIDDDSKGIRMNLFQTER